MDQRGVVKLDTAFELVDANTKQSLRALKEQAKIFDSVKDLIGEDSFLSERHEDEGNMSQISAALVTPQNLGENDSPNPPVILTPISSKATRKELSIFKQLFVSSAARETTPGNCFPQTPLSREVSFAQDDCSVIMNTEEEEPVETDLSVPLYCREALVQSIDIENAYRTTCVPIWRDEVDFRGGYYSEGECRHATYDGSVHCSVPLVEFERRFPKTDGLADQTELEINIVPEQTEFTELTIPVFLSKRRTAQGTMRDLRIGDRIKDYEIFSPAGQGTFSKTFACKYLGADASMPARVCVKMITNKEEGVFDQSLCEISILSQLRDAGGVENRIVGIFECFYYNSHLLIVEELHHDNLYEVLDMFRGAPKRYFTEQNLKLITRQMLEALDFVHSQGVIHADIKAENILLKKPTQINVAPDCVLVDFGSAKFEEEECKETYVQSRPYRAPEVILGCSFGPKIDIWSLGCLIAELRLEHLLFDNKSVPGMLAQMIGISGPFPQWMIDCGTESPLFFRQGYLYENFEVTCDRELDDNDQDATRSQVQQFVRVYFPKPSCIADRVQSTDPLFVEFLEAILIVDPNLRPTAKEALQHPWLA